VRGAQDDLSIAFRSLIRLRHLASDDRTLAQVNEQSIGRPRAIWRTDFVSRLAHLWQILTGVEASKAEDSLFGSFVYEAWNSLDAEMPEVSFARALRDKT
jgi:hypothetical protein